MNEKGESQEFSPEDEQPIDWEAIRQQVIDKIREYAITSNKESSEKEILDNNVDDANNFHEYFPGTPVRAWMESTIINGRPKPASQEENENTTLRERYKEFNENFNKNSFKIEPAEGPQDFFSKRSEKFFNTTVAQFFRDIDNALKLAGLTEDDFENKTYKKKAKQKSVVGAYQYLVAMKGYNYRDLCS